MGPDAVSQLSIFFLIFFIFLLSEVNNQTTKNPQKFSAYCF